MSSAGANCFLNSKSISFSIGPNPSTTRGESTIINCHPKEPLIIYPSGKFVVIRNVEKPDECFIYRGHSMITTCAKFSPNGYWICSADISGKIRVWSWDNPEHLTKLESAVFSGAVYDLDWDCESKKIVAVGEGSGMLAKVFTWDTGNSVGEMVGHNKRVLSVSFKPSRPFRIFTGSADMRTILYTGPPFKFDHSNSSHSNTVTCVRYSVTGNTLVSVGSDKKIQFYDPSTGQPTQEIVNAHEGTIFSAAFNCDGTKLATASADKSVKIWDVSSLTLLSKLNISEDPQVGDMQVGVTWINDKLISLSLNGDINILDSESRNTIQSHQVGITTLCFDKVDKIVYTGSFDGVVMMRNLVSGESKKLVGSDKKNIAGASHGGKVVGLVINQGELISIGWDDSLRFASISSFLYNNSISLNIQPCGICCSDSLVAVATSSQILLFQSQCKVGSIENLNYQPSCLCFLSDDEIAVGGEDNKVHLYKINEFIMSEIFILEARSPVSSLSLSPDGNYFAVGDSGRTIEVYDKNSREPQIKGKWVFHTSRITALAWSPSGQYLASGSLDENIFIWDFSSPSKKCQIPFAHMGGVSGINWVDDKSFVSCGQDGVFCSWNIPSFI